MAHLKNKLYPSTGAPKAPIGRQAEVLSWNLYMLVGYL